MTSSVSDDVLRSGMQSGLQRQDPFLFPKDNNKNNKINKENAAECASGYIVTCNSFLKIRERRSRLSAGD